MSSVFSNRTSQLVSRLLLRSGPPSRFMLKAARRISPGSTDAAASHSSSAQRLHARPGVIRSFFTRPVQSSSSQQPATSPGMRTRLSKLMRENGWVAVGIYTALSLLDFTACFLLVNAVGADVVKKGEQWIWTRLGFQVVELSPEEEAASGKEKTTVWTRLALAYGIHKTLLLPFRVGVTAWVTPASVRLLRSYGWKVGPAAKGVASKAAKEVTQKAT